jgi:hypothetical protein
MHNKLEPRSADGPPAKAALPALITRLGAEELNVRVAAIQAPAGQSAFGERSHVIARRQSRCTEPGQRCNDLSSSWHGTYFVARNLMSLHRGGGGVQ